MNVEHITPILNVSDMAQSLAWFESLGWSRGFAWGDPVSFASVQSGEAEIFLCHDGQGGRGKGSNTHTFKTADDQRADQGVWMSWWVKDVDAAHRRCVEQGVEVTQPPETMPWNVREMHIRHPDGHVFRVGQGLEA